MRISIRRCLSMLRKTSDGNELALPAINAYPKEHSVSHWYTVKLRSQDHLDTTVGVALVSVRCQDVD